MVYSQGSSSRVLVVTLSVSLVVCGLMLIATKGDLQHGSSTLQSTTPSARSRSTRRKLGADCEKTCQNAPFKDLEYFDGDVLLKPATMLERLQKSRKEWVEKGLKKDYGAKYYKDMFEPLEKVFNNETKKEEEIRHSAGRQRIFQDPSILPSTKRPENENLPSEGPAWGRMVRKMQMKILQVQLGVLEERKNAKPICLDDCSKKNNEEGSRRFLAKAKASGGLYTKFTWATGGHSASAGHGNLFRESYTANMDRALSPILASIGLDFEARNYAMGGTDSAEEVALCMNSIFGRDVDAISWDYGMTDGHDLWKVTMYAYKAAGISRVKDGLSQPGNVGYRPAFFPIHQQVGVNLVAKNMLSLGMTSLAYNDVYMRETILSVAPDMFGMHEDEIAKAPKYLQYLKCEGKIEAGDPGCKDNKFNNSLCPNRKARTSWHPGWKYHALMGNLMAMTFVDLVEDALQGLIEMELDATGDDIDAAKKLVSNKLSSLDKEEKKDYEGIFSNPIPTDLMPHVDRYWTEAAKEHLKDISVESFLKEPSFCHSALLPAEIRFKGLLTENFTNVGTIMDQSYEDGASSGAVFQIENPSFRSGKEPAPYEDPRPERNNGLMRLVREDNGRQQCEEYVNLDYKDYFYVGSVTDWQTLVLPNKSEKNYYKEFDAAKSKGWILACLTRCDWGKCPGGDVHAYFGWQRPQPRKDEEPPSEEEIAKKGKAEMTINGVKVTEASGMHTCYALRNKDGHVWKPNKDGQYEIKTRITGAEKHAFIRFSAIVLI
ncbi:expressed unknown protein [Seminavis robusta]|uniref:Uncharacterized protein n=1 Tax=Seminavis robusta TaxID=568900 RepID=A0A9N8H647_9STRA|nr:expressed unknown protein [Seminavis robusta]|eukprot:Sro161_g072380.1 n/a (772) ;mRNA; f:16059-18791